MLCGVGTATFSMAARLGWSIQNRPLGAVGVAIIMTAEEVEVAVEAGGTTGHVVTKSTSLDYREVVPGRILK